ncbi:hypothetical protein IU468_21765 [Nocardia farcinica]|uniref:hypothetical protein n=1 Tax=Nocardia farcinica TaxID=37329 RepID=UPI00189521E4|nr:hypothetical protein [Nocardia farcinica]MBF6258929.1 hypothetical protein [Nocardia farcinica]
MERATVYRWNIRNGTGVLTRTDGSLAWFHLSTVDKGDVFTLSEGDPGDAEIENVPQGGMNVERYPCGGTWSSSWSVSAFVLRSNYSDGCAARRHRNSFGPLDESDKCPPPRTAANNE